MTDQSRMFDHEDLPLFSDTAPRARSERFAPEPAPTQEHLGQCAVCEDTGTLHPANRWGRRYCTCEAGAEAWKRDQQARK